MAPATFTLRATYNKPNGEPQIQSRPVHIYVTGTKQVKDTAGNVIISGRVEADVVDGVLTVPGLPDPRDPGYNPDNFGLTVSAVFRDNHPPAVSFGAEALDAHLTNGVLELEDVTPVDPSTFTPNATYADASTVTALDSRVTTVESDITTKADAADVPNDTTIAAWVDDTQTQTGRALATTYGRESATVQHAATPRLRGPRAGRTVRQVSTPASGHNAFPGLALTRDRSRLVAVWRNGASHVWSGTGASGTIQTAYSEDLGATWSAPTIAHSAADDCRDPSLTTLSDGTLLASGFHHNGTAPTGGFILASVDGGLTWVQRGTFTGADAGLTWAACSGPALELTSGDLLLAVYGAAPGDSYYSSRLLLSTDSGATWSSLSTVADGQAASRNYTETYLGLLNDGRIMGLIRAGDTEIYRVYSSDDGATWDAPVKVQDGYGRPSWVNSGGVLFLSFKDLESGSTGRGGALLSTSHDDGETWTAPVEYHPSVAQGGAYYVYAELVPVARGVIANLYAMQTSDGNSEVWFRYVTEGAPTPLGDVLGAPLSVEASLHLGDVLAFDTFRRDDEVLFHADSDARWQGNTGITVSGQRAAHTGAAGAVSFKTIGLATPDVRVDTSMTHAGTLGHGVVVRYIDSSNYLVAQLETNGNALRLYKYDAGTPTLLGTAAMVYHRANTWADVSVIARGDRIKVFQDGDKVIDHTLSSAEKAKYDAGVRHGFKTNGTGQAFGPIVIRR